MTPHCEKKWASVCKGETAGDTESLVKGQYTKIFKRFYLFIFRERGGREKERETLMCGCLASTPYWGPGPQPRHVP